MATGSWLDNALHYSGLGALFGGGDNTPKPQTPGPLIRQLAKQFDPDQTAGLNALVSASRVIPASQRAQYLAPVLQGLPAQLAQLQQAHAQQSRFDQVMPFLSSWLQDRAAQSTALADSQAAQIRALSPSVSASYQPILENMARARSDSGQQEAQALVNAFQVYPLLQMYQRQLGMSGDLFGGLSGATQKQSSSSSPQQSLYSSIGA